LICITFIIRESLRVSTSRGTPESVYWIRVTTTSATSLEPHAM